MKKLHSNISIAGSLKNDNFGIRSIWDPLKSHSKNKKITGEPIDTVSCPLNIKAKHIP